MQRTEGLPAMPPAPSAPEAPKKKGKAIKIAGIVVGGFIALSAISAALSTPEKAPAAAPIETPADITDSVESTEPTDPTEPEPATAPEIVEPVFTVSQENAIDSAQSYLDFGAFSESGLIEQLSSEYGEGFSKADAVFAVNHIDVNWNEQAAKSAQSYLDFGSFSRQGLIEQLESEYGEGFTHSQAVYGVNPTGL